MGGVLAGGLFFGGLFLLAALLAGGVVGRFFRRGGAVGDDQFLAHQHGAADLRIEVGEGCHRDVKFDGDIPQRVALLDGVGLPLAGRSGG